MDQHSWMKEMSHWAKTASYRMVLGHNAIYMKFENMTVSMEVFLFSFVWAAVTEDHRLGGL